MVLRDPNPIEGQVCVRLSGYVVNTEAFQARLNCVNSVLVFRCHEAEVWGICEMWFVMNINQVLISQHQKCPKECGNPHVPRQHLATWPGPGPHQRSLLSAKFLLDRWHPRYGKPPLAELWRVYTDSKKHSALIPQASRTLNGLRVNICVLYTFCLSPGSYRKPGGCQKEEYQVLTEQWVFQDVFCLLRD